MANPFSTFIGPDGTGYEVKDAAARESISALEEKSEATNVAYGTCATAADVAAKAITASGNKKWRLAAGSIIAVKFSDTNTAQNPTFNVNGTGAKPVWYNTAPITTGSLSYAGYANRTAIYVYDGTQYVFLGWSVDSNTTYTNASLGQGYGTCGTAEATVAKAVTLSSYSLVAGGIVAVKFTYAVPASATMNINGKGAKAIYHKGAAITAGTIKAGDVGVFIYNGSQYHLLAIDIAAGTTPVERGGTGNTSVDTTPTNGSTKMVTSGGVHAALKKYLLLTGGDLTGNIMIWAQSSGNLPGVHFANPGKTKQSCMQQFDSGGIQLYTHDYGASTNAAQLLIYPPDVQSDAAKALLFGHNGTNYHLFGKHNKPSGTYTGNGSAASRAINIGGIGRVLAIYSSNGNALVINYGGLTRSTSVGVLLAGDCNFVNGVLTLATTNAMLNANGVTYNYEVL